VILLLLVGLGLYAFWLEPASLQVREIELPLLPPGSHPIRVAALSDLHVGSPYHGLPGLRRAVDLTNASRPDLICLLGDFVTKGVIGGTFVPPEPIAQELARLRAPRGVLAVLGNHDRLVDGARVERALVGVGIRVLEDTAAALDGPDGRFWVAGVSDMLTGRHDVARALAAVTDSVSPVIVISHSPDIFPRVPARPVLTLVGHTHGGQVSLPLLGPPIVPSRYGRRYAAGHIVEGGRHLFVSTGIGTSFIPVRFMVPPTVFLLKLTARR
jgi:predicted MPP superfamily phosphohydrolase